ncbi:MAG TPA: hypothetical protein VFR85_00060 [Anaeromyxobacteraceae bacterium]|nr:hypothetical protein [Anaeromyxobacteraceae bacterium]
MRQLASILGALVLSLPQAALARGGRGAAGAAGAGPGSRGAAPGASSASCATGGHRPSGGRPDETWATSRREDFRRRTPCPSTGRTRGACPGYEVVDVPPSGRGEPWTLRWATPQEAERARAESPWLVR